MKKKPNFILFITDQQRADWLGCYGHPVLRTPNIDALAARGTRYTDFHVASPVCMPNRASLMTGRYPTVNGLRYNGCLLPDRANTFVDVLAAAGWHTAAIGKCHLQPFLDEPAPNATPAPDGPVTEAWKPDNGDYGQEQPDRYAETEPYEFRTPYYGFQHVDMVTGHGIRCGGHYRQWLRDQANDWQAVSDPSNGLDHDYTCPQANRTQMPEALYPTAYIRDRAIDFVEGAKDVDAPFFLVVSFPDPHHPFNPPGKYWDIYAPEDFAVDLPFADHENPTPPMQFLRDAWKNGETAGLATSALMVSDREVQEAKALTAGMIAMIDDAVGSVIEALDSQGLSDDTVVAFTSDHGDYLGDFNMLLKGAMPFRSITQVPFIWADPAADPAPLDARLASTLDISATILERAGLAPYRGMQGQSLLTGAQRDALLIEYNDGLARLGFDTPARVRSLVTPDWRLTIYGGQDWGELYNLSKDPKETKNLWDDPDRSTDR